MADEKDWLAKSRRNRGGRGPNRAGRTWCRLWPWPLRLLC